MSGKRKRARLFWREQGGAQRAYADFRDYADVGGRREALIVPDEALATTDAEVAEVLAAKRLAELNKLRARRQGRAVHGLPKETTLAEFAREHLIAKAKAGTATQGWVAESEHYLQRALGFFGEHRPLDAITVADVRKWSEQLHTESNGRGGTMSGGTIRHHLNCLSNLFRRAQAEGFVPPGYNPVAALMEKPRAKPQEARWMEVHEAALLLEAARTYRPARGDLAVPFAYPLLATFLLTGGRTSEVLGLEVGDVSFDRKTITFRPNQWRRLKTATSLRAVPMWLQLEAILRAYVFDADRPPSHLLFPSYRTGEETMLTDFRKLLDAVAVRAGWRPGEIRVSLFTVAKELGHGGEAMVRRVYGHLGQVRHRAEEVEYRIEAFQDKLKGRLAALRGAV